MKRLGVLLLSIALLAAPLRAGDKGDDERQKDEEFVQKLLEIVEKAAEAADAQELDRTPYGSLQGADLEAAEEITRHLDNQRLSLNFEDTTFSDAIDFFRDTTGLNIVITKTAKDLVEGMPKLKLKLKDVKVRNAFELVLGQSDAQLRYGVKNGVLEIGTVEDWKTRDLVLDVIPIDDLVYRAPDFPAPQAGLDALDKGNKWKK